MFLSKGKHKVLTDEESDNDQDDIDGKIKAADTRATKTDEAKKSFLDIIAKITYGETTTTSTTQQPPIKSLSRTHRASNKRKNAQPSVNAATMQASKELETKKAKSD